MALKKKTVVLNLAQSGDQKTDPKSLTPGSPTLVENAQFAKGNRVDKRFGYDVLGQGDVEEFYQEFSFYSVDDLLTAQRINVFDDGEDGISLAFVQNIPVPSFTAFLAELQAFLNVPNGRLGIRDKSNVDWLIVYASAITIQGSVVATDFAQTIIRLKLSGVDHVTITKDGVPSTTAAFLADFAVYAVSDDSEYAANNPEGMESYLGPQIFTDRKAIVGTEEHLLLLADGKVHSYSETLDTFPEIGPHRPAEITLDSINEDGRVLMSADCIHAAGVTYYAHLESATDPEDSVMSVIAVDEATGERIFGPIIVGNDQISTIRLLLFKGNPYVFYYSNNTVLTNGDLFGRKLFPTGLGDEVLLRPDVFNLASQSASNFWNILNYKDDRLVINYPASLTICLTRYFDEDLDELVSPPARSNTFTTAVPINAVVSSSDDRFFVFGGGDADALQYFVIDDIGDVITAVTNVGITAAPQMQNRGIISTVVSPENLNGVDGVRGYLGQDTLTFVIPATTTDVRGTISWHIANDGTLADNTGKFKDGYGYEVISKGYVFEGNTYYLLYRPAPNDTCYYIGSWEGSNLIITGQVLYGRAPDGASRFRPFMFNMNFTEISPGVARVAVLTKDLATSVTGMDSIKVDFTSKDTFSAEPYGRSMLIAGTNLHAFCGQYFRELGFFHIPRKPILSQTASAGQISAGTYIVVAVYEFTDRNGYLHRSGPSPAETIVVASGTTNTILASIECYNVTNLSGDDTLVGIIAYRSVAGGSTLHRDAYYDFTDFGAQDAEPDNQKNFTFNDANQQRLTRSDDELATQAQLIFTPLGEKPPSPIPPVKYISTWGSRIWAAGSARDENIYFSKINQTNLMPEFSELFSISVQDKPGRTTGIKGMTDKIILSKRGRLFFSYGDGPDNTGGGGLFAKFEEIPGVSGAISGRSMVVNKNGINYRSDKGVYTLTPGLETVFTGAAYEDSIDEEILEAITPIDSETLRFVTATGILSYNNFFNAWSKDSSASLLPIDATLYANKFHVLTATQLLRENLNKWTDGDTSYDILVETGWISFSGLAGFQRFYKLFIVMDNLTPYTVKVSLAYDYGDYESETIYTDVADSRIIIYPTKQKCEAFRFKIEATGTSGTEQSLNINFVAVEAGIKSGLPKQLPVAQRIGVTTI